MPLSLPEVTVAAWITAPIYCAFLTPERSATANLQSTADNIRHRQTHGTPSLLQAHMDPDAHAWMHAGTCTVTGTTRARSARAMQSTAER
jgi:hypothetical protein